MKRKRRVRIYDLGATTRLTSHCSALRTRLLSASRRGDAADKGRGEAAGDEKEDAHEAARAEGLLRGLVDLVASIKRLK